MSKSIFDNYESGNNVETGVKRSEQNVKKNDSEVEVQEQKVQEDEGFGSHKVNFDQASSEPSQEASIQAAMAAVNGKAGSGASGTDSDTVSDEEDKIAAITDEEEELAEEIIFKGYAEKQVEIPFLRKRASYITVCTTTPQEVTFLNQTMYEILTKLEDESGNVKMPSAEITTLKVSIENALGYVGLNGEDACTDKTTATSRVLKMSIRKLNEIELSGDIEKASQIRESIIENLMYRVQVIKRMPNQFSDFIADARYVFENRMYEIMQNDAIFAK